MRESLEWDLCFVMLGFLGKVVEAVKVERVIMRMAPTKTHHPQPTEKFFSWIEGGRGENLRGKLVNVA